MLSQFPKKPVGNWLKGWVNVLGNPYQKSSLKNGVQFDCLLPRVAAPSSNGTLSLVWVRFKWIKELWAGFNREAIAAINHTIAECCCPESVIDSTSNIFSEVSFCPTGQKEAVEAV
jgi:hypothetical protein